LNSHRQVSAFVAKTEQASIESHRPVTHPSLPRDIVNTLEPAYKQAQSRLQLIDLEGGPVADCAKGPAVIDEVLDLINGFTSTAAVYLLSSYGNVFLEPLLERMPDVGCVSENGCEVRLAGSKGWEDLTHGTDLSWRPIVHELLAYVRSLLRSLPHSLIEPPHSTPSGHPARGWRTEGRRSRGISARTTSPSTPRRTSGCVRRAHQPAEGSRRGPPQPRRQAAETQNAILDSLGERASLQIVSGVRAFLVRRRQRASASIGGLTPIQVMPRRVSRIAATGYILAEHGADAFDYILSLSGDERLHGFLRRLRCDGAESYLHIDTVGVGERHREPELCVASSKGALEVLRGLSLL
jgi:hypothetical protein